MSKWSLERLFIRNYKFVGSEQLHSADVDALEMQATAELRLAPMLGNVTER